MLSKFFIPLWSVYQFKDPDMDSYARQKLTQETQQGLKVMSTLLILLILIAMLLFEEISQIKNYSLNYFWVIALATHINISARIVKDIKTLHALGMTLLIISATAYLFIAHQTGGFSPLLLANIVLLFMIVPMVPWGLREALLVVCSIYLMLTLSTFGVKERFDDETLRALQFFLIAAGATSLLLVIRATWVRKHELLAHFRLKKAHQELFMLSHRDPLTGAWNRRYIHEAVEQLIQRYQNQKTALYFVIFDLDAFKKLNDTFGHDFGDRTLIILSQTIDQTVKEQGFLIRIGGDEFILLLAGLDPEQLMPVLKAQALAAIQQEQPQAQFGLSWGCVCLPLAPIDDLESTYQSADRHLYLNKQARRQTASSLPLSA